MTSQSKSNDRAFDILAQADIDQSVIDSIEERHNKIEDALEQERQLYFDLANSQPTGVYRLRICRSSRCKEDKWRSSDDAPYIIEFVNVRFCEILNVDLEFVQAKPAFMNDLIFESDKESFIQKNIESDRDLTPFIWEGRLFVRNQLIWCHFESTPRLLPNGDVVWTGVLLDISKRKKEQQEIQAKNEELLKANAEKNKFFSIIAHDLKTPFNGIVGFSRLLISEIKQKNFDDVERYAEMVLESSDSALILLTNLMEWAGSQTGRIVFEPKLCEMYALINDTVNMFSQISEIKKIKVEIDAAVNIPIIADVSMISTILRNLISNAIKFTHKGGKIVIKVEQLLNHLKIIVSDNGVGIPESVIPKIFRIDEKHSTRGTADEKGTGLGLILCKDFVEKHNGEIWVESTVGEGSNFIFTLENQINKF